MISRAVHGGMPNACRIEWSEMRSGAAECKEENGREDTKQNATKTKQKRKHKRRAYHRKEENGEGQYEGMAEEWRSVRVACRAFLGPFETLGDPLNKMRPQAAKFGTHRISDTPPLEFATTGNLLVQIGAVKIHDADY